jgi:hypothetical protein
MRRIIRERKIDPEYGPATGGINLDHTAMIGNNAGNHRQTKPGASSFCGDERIEDMVPDIR